MGIERIEVFKPIGLLHHRRLRVKQFSQFGLVALQGFDTTVPPCRCFRTALRGLDRFTHVHGVSAHLYCQSDLANPVTLLRAHHDIAESLDLGRYRSDESIESHAQPYFSAVALPQNTRYMNTVYATITGSVMATPKKITFSDAVLMAASHTVMRPITMSGKML